MALGNMLESNHGCGLDIVINSLLYRLHNVDSGTVPGRMLDFDLKFLLDCDASRIYICRLNSEDSGTWATGHGRQ